MVVWRAPPAPEEHFLGDDLMAARGLLDNVAAAEEQERGLDVDLHGADDSGAGCTLSLAGHGVGHNHLTELLDEAVIATEIVITLWRRGIEADLDELAAGQEVTERGRQVAGDDAEARCLGGDLDAEDGGERAGHEGLHRPGIADRLVDGT